MFTGDRSGDWLYAALYRAGLANQPTSVSADDGLQLTDTYVDRAGALRAAGQQADAPPSATPAGRGWCANSSCSGRSVRAVVVLGGFGWAALWPALRAAASRLPPRLPPFGHGVEVEVDGRRVIGCYHVSQQNTFTGRLTEPMLDAVFARAVRRCIRERWSAEWLRDQPHPDRRRRLRRHVHGARAAAEAVARRCRDHRRRPAVEHDLPAVPARGGGRQRRAAPRRRPAAQGAAQVHRHHRRGHPHHPRARTATDPAPATARPTSSSYDLLVVVPGSISRLLPIPGLAEHGIGFKTIGEAIYLRNHVLSRLDLAASTADPVKRRARADLRVRRRRLRRRRGDRRTRGHGALRAALRPAARPGRDALGAGRGGEPDHARGVGAAVGLHRRPADRARHRRAAEHPARVGGGRAHPAVRRRGVRRRHPGVDGRGQGEPDAGRHRSAARRQGPAAMQGQPDGQGRHRRVRGRRLRGRPGPDEGRPERAVRAERPARRAAVEGARRQRGVLPCAAARCATTNTPTSARSRRSGLYRGVAELYGDQGARASRPGSCTAPTTCRGCPPSTARCA